MSLQTVTAALRLCGNCVHASRRLGPHDIQKLKRKAHYKQQYFTYLVLLRRYANWLRDKKVLCRREKIKVSLFEQACAFWRPHH